MFIRWTMPLTAVVCTALISTPAAADAPPPSTSLVANAVPPDSAAPPPHAVPATPPPEGYDAAIQQGFAAFQAGDYGSARDRFLFAQNLAPSARVLKALAMVEYELGHYPESARYGEQALASPDRPLSQVSRAEAEQLLARARASVGRYTLTLVPRDATVRLDGQNLTLTDGETLALGAGAHSLEVHAALHQTSRHTLQVSGGEREQLSFVLSKRGGPSETPLVRKWWLWTGVGAAVAGGVTAGVLLAMRKHGDHASTSVPQDGALIHF